MNKPKAQGTAFETQLVQHFNGSGLSSRRLAEGGSSDPGDLEVRGLKGHAMRHPYPVDWVVEAKCTQKLSISTAWEKASKKAGESPCALIWKRMVKPKPGGVKRSSEIYVVLDLETFTSLIGGEKE